MLLSLLSSFVIEEGRDAPYWDFSWNLFQAFSCQIGSLCLQFGTKRGGKWMHSILFCLMLFIQIAGLRKCYLALFQFWMGGEWLLFSNLCSSKIRSVSDCAFSWHTVPCRDIILSCYKHQTKNNLLLLDMNHFTVSIGWRISRCWQEGTRSPKRTTRCCSFWWVQPIISQYLPNTWEAVLPKVLVPRFKSTLAAHLQ